MRILFLISGTMWRHTLPEGFVEAGHEVDFTVSISDQSIQNKISQFQPDLAISIGWGTAQTIKNQLLMRKCLKASKTPHVYWSTEDPAYTSIFSLPLIQRVQPDFVFSICPETVLFYTKMGIKSAHMDFGYSPGIHTHIECDETYKSTISIVANAYPDILRRYPNHYRHQSMAALIVPLLKNNIEISFWGKDWDKVKDYVKNDIPDEWIHGYLPYTEANKVYCSSDIILGLQNYPDQLTQRTYEILASSSFLLTSDTPAIRNSFKAGEQLVVSSSPDETLQLVKYYLDKPDERKKIAASGKAAIWEDTYKNRAEYMLETLKKYEIV